MGFLKRLFDRNKIMPTRKMLDGWTETKISEDTFYASIPQEVLDKWQIQRWKKDKIERLVKKDGFHLKEDGRCGTIYFIENEKFCEIDFEISGVSQYDILIFFDNLSQWVFPLKKKMTDVEKEIIKNKLEIWLKAKKIKAEI